MEYILNFWGSAVPLNPRLARLNSFNSYSGSELWTVMTHHIARTYTPGLIQLFWAAYCNDHLRAMDSLGWTFRESCRITSMLRLLTNGRPWSSGCRWLAKELLSQFTWTLPSVMIERTTDLNLHVCCAGFCISYAYLSLSHIFQSFSWLMDLWNRFSSRLWSAMTRHIVRAPSPELLLLFWAVDLVRASSKWYYSVS